MQATDIQATPSSVALARYQLNDGDGITDDPDGAPTTITAITFSISTSGVPGSTGVRNIALYDNADVEIAEQAFIGPNVTFTGLSITAADFASTKFTLRASFKDSPLEIVDLDDIRSRLSMFSRVPVPC